MGRNTPGNSDHSPAPMDDAAHQSPALDAHGDGEHTGHEGQEGRSPQDVMGHGGHHGGMSMDQMILDMRKRFLVAALLSVPITLWSPIGREILGFTTPAPFGLRDDVFALILSLPVIFYSAWIFFDGAFRALRAKTLDMMVLVAVAVGTGWLYSLAVTLTGGGEALQAATVLTSRCCSVTGSRCARVEPTRRYEPCSSSPPMAVVIRDGEEIEVPTADVVVGDLLLRPGRRSPWTESSVGESEVDSR